MLKKTNFIKSLVKAMVWEFKFIFRDKAIFSAFIGVALFVAFLYSYVYSKEVLVELPIAVVDNDNTTHSRLLLRMIDGAKQTKIEGYYNDLQQAKNSFLQSKNRGVVVIPANFSRKLQRGEQPKVSVYADASYILYYKQVLTSVKTAVAYMNAGIQIKKNLAQGSLPNEAKNKALPVKAKTVSLFNIDSGYATFLIPIVLVIIFQTTMLNAIGMLGGTIRENKKMRRLFPEAKSFLGALSIVLGRGITYLILGLIVLLIIVGVFFPFYNIVVRSSMLNIVVFMIPFLLSIVFLGIFLMNFFSRQEDSILFVMFSSLPALLITGFSWPIDAMPSLIQKLSYFVPSTLGAKGFIGLSQLGADFYIIKEYWLMMWGVCLFYLVLSVLTFKRIYFIEGKKHIVCG